MTKKVHKLQQLSADDLAAAGGKASTLSRLIQSGYPVPGGFVIFADAFPGGGLEDNTWEEAQEELSTLRNGNGRMPLAVRSSALGEDSSFASFAGEFDSILNVVDETAVRQAIIEVHKSGQSERVKAYSRAQGIKNDHQVAVIVQEMIAADLAGVLFTADPLTGSHGQMVGNFVEGLGEQLVSGTATPQAFTLARPNGRYEGPPVMKKYARRLYRLADKIAEEFGSAQDIEWAVAGNELFILQARPITTLQGYDPRSGEWNDSRRGDYLWTNSNFGEALPSVMTPLTWSLIQIYAEETVPPFLPSYHPIMGNIGGRFYFNVSLFASMMRAVGYSRERMDYESEEFFGNLPEDLNIPFIPLSRWAIARRLLPQLIRIRRRRADHLRRLPEFTAGASAEMEIFRSRISSAQTGADLAAIWEEMLEPYMREACRMLQAGTSEYENVVRPLRHELRDQVGEAQANLLLSGVSRESDTLASLGPLVGLWQVAQGEMSRPEYLDLFGHRGPDELELSLPRPAEDPGWIDQQLPLLASVDIPQMLNKHEAERQEAWENYSARYPQKVKMMKKKLDKAAGAARGREAIRSEFTRFFSVVREFSQRAADMSGLGSRVYFLSYAELIAYLQGEGREIIAAIPTRQAAHERLSALPPYPAIINGRFDPYAWAADPDRRSDLYDVRQPRESEAPDTNRTAVSGFPGSAGVAVGIVRRLDSPQEGHSLRAGEILVTLTTNVGWTPLFPRAGAVVTDVGAPLSHAAIVARELGIPAVVGCGDATMRLSTGDRVRVDGSRGIVEILWDAQANNMEI